jgi:hypothetical protein
VRPFLTALREGLRLAESPNPKVPGLFKPGDADHLRRWLNDKRAATIFAKLTKGEARRIASNIAKLPELLPKPITHQ